MPLTAQDRRWLERHEKLIEAGGSDEEIAIEISAAVAQCQRTLGGGGIAYAIDERADALVAAVTRYALESMGRT